MCLSGKPPITLSLQLLPGSTEKGIINYSVFVKHLEDESAGCGTAPFTSQYMGWLLFQVHLLTV